MNPEDAQIPGVTPGLLPAGFFGHSEPMFGDRRIRGYCPWGCGETLFIAASGFVTCSNPGCDRPTGLSAILSDPETEDLVRRIRGEWIVKHPLRERMGNALFNCKVPTTPPVPPRGIVGVYRVTRKGNGWEWEEVPQV